MTKSSTVAWRLLCCLLMASASAHRHMMQQEPIVPETGMPDPSNTPTDLEPTQEGLGVEDDPFRIDPTPGPIEIDPTQMGRRNGFYRCGCLQAGASQFNFTQL